MEEHISPKTMREVRHLLADKLGWDASSVNEKLLSRVITQQMLVAEISDEMTFVRQLKVSDSLFNALIEKLVVCESWFFRDRGAFEYLIHYLREHWWHKRREERLSILSVGCSRGEEPYSIVMTLLDAGLTEKDFEVHGIDISQKALNAAKRGIYSKRSFRDEDVAFRSRYFTKLDDSYELTKAVREAVHFSIENVFCCRECDPCYDLIFCRNLLIYLHSTAQEKVVEALNKRLKSSGVLLVGPSEMGLLRKRGYCSVGYPRASAFWKREARQRPAPVKPVVTRVMEPQLIEEERDADVILSEASDLADHGLLQEAQSLCEQHLAKHGDSSQAYFIMGLIRHAMHREDHARELFRKAVYLDPDYYEALVYLALLADMEMDTEKASSYRMRAEKALKKKNES